MRGLSRRDDHDGGEPAAFVPKTTGGITRSATSLNGFLGNKQIHPYSDFLLHDMGSLGDGITSGAAGPRQMRTSPLWGVRAKGRFLHDGRAESIAEAIGLHDGQAAAARNAFNGIDGGPAAAGPGLPEHDLATSTTRRGSIRSTRGGHRRKDFDADTLARRLSLLVVTRRACSPACTHGPTPSPSDDPLRVFAARRLDDEGKLDEALPL